MSERIGFNPESIRVNNCRGCDSPRLEDILALGSQRVVSFTEDEKLPPSVPLTLALCGDCHLLQLRDTTRPDLLWGDDYGYRSGVNETMKKELAGIAHEVERVAGVTRNDIVIDIGCNDGTLLKSYENDPIRVGFDPSRNVARYAGEYFDSLDVSRYTLFYDYFTRHPYLRRYPEHSAKAITAVAMFYDLEHPNRFLDDVKACLAPEGVFVIQQNYLKGMLEQLAFDNICHEHLEYYTLLTLEPILAKSGLEVFDVSQNNINGGSFRTLIRNRGASVGGEVSPAVEAMRQAEREAGLDKKETYELFAERVNHSGTQLKTFIDAEVAKGSRVYAYGASTRGGTLLQFSKIDHTQIIGAADRNPDKWGKIMKTTGIPIVSEQEAREKADIFIVLPWFFAQGEKSEFIQREWGFLLRGGRIVVPLPEFKVYSIDQSY